MSTTAKLYFIGCGLNMSRCVGGPENRDMIGVGDSHTFMLPEGMSETDCLSKSPKQILDMGAELLSPKVDPWERCD